MSNTSPCKRSTYDIIIAGGGTAGCVLGARLSEVPDLYVLVLEAGENHNDDPRTKIPGAWVKGIASTDLNWNNQFVPQTELNGRKPFLARGKGLGGSTLINATSLLYPSRAGFDAWVDLGNKGWDWDSLAPYIKKFQNFNKPSDKVAEDLQLEYVNPKEQGVGGPIQASYEKNVEPLDKAWVETFRNLNLDMKADTVSGKSLGGYSIVNTIDSKTRQRSHAGVAYLEPATDRPNLEVITGALIDKIVLATDGIDKEPRVTGIEFSHNNQTHIASTTERGEIILCAGAVGSPAVLERSGIGKPTILEKVGINTTVENDNVGENFHDHFFTAVSFEINPGIPTKDDFRDPANIQKAMQRYAKDGSGPMGCGNPSFAFMPLLEPETADHLSDPTHNRTHQTNGTSPSKTSQAPFSDILTKLTSNPDITPTERVTTNLLSNPNEASANLTLMKAQVHLNHDDLQNMFNPVNPGNYITIGVAPCHPLSRGSIHITSPSPQDPPLIDPKYYTHPLDIELISRHLQFLPQLTSTPPLRDMIKQAPHARTIPEDANFDTLEETTKIMKTSCMSFQHPCGTCAMLPRDQGGVVDTRVRVYGVKGLRVCDASVFPLIPRGTLMCTVYAVAERVADLVKEDFGVGGVGGV